MSETTEQTAARFKAKDEEYARRASTGKWSMLECDNCRYWACMSCGKGEHGPCLLCRSCGSQMVQRVVCCQRHYHHVGDCCVHCGNDERIL